MNQSRTKGQKLISIPINERFVAILDESLSKMGYSDRSSFIRDAISEKLGTAGIVISTKLRLAPNRTGKGGRPTFKSKIDVEEKNH